MDWGEERKRQRVKGKEGGREGRRREIPKDQKGVLWARMMGVTMVTYINP